MIMLTTEGPGGGGRLFSKKTAFRSSPCYSSSLIKTLELFIILYNSAVFLFYSEYIVAVTEGGRKALALTRLCFRMTSV